MNWLRLSEQDFRSIRGDRPYSSVHMLGTMRLHNASLPPGRTRELCLDFFAAVATLNSLREGARINARATPWFLTSFQTSSSGLFPASTAGERTIGSGLSPGARSDAPTCPCALDILSSKNALLLGYKLGTRVAVGSGPTRRPRQPSVHSTAQTKFVASSLLPPPVYLANVG